MKNGVKGLNPRSFTNSASSISLKIKPIYTEGMKIIMIVEMKVVFNSVMVSGVIWSAAVVQNNNFSRLPH
jgi:hypothetical protein